MLQTLPSALQRLRSHFAHQQACHDDAYLNEAVDCCDLERRQRELERQQAVMLYANGYMSMGRTPEL